MKDDKSGGPITWKLHIPADCRQIFEALTSDEGRTSFWAEAAPEVDGRIEFRFINGQTERSRIVERVPPRIFAIEYFGAVARFQLTPDGKGGTDLLLTHEGVPADEWHEVHAGWLNVLFPLKAWVAYGVDLRNHDAKRGWQDGYADQ